MYDYISNDMVRDKKHEMISKLRIFLWYSIQDKKRKISTLQFLEPFRS